VLSAPELDVTGYLRGVARCRERFPGLRVLSGLEVSEPHWHQDGTAALLAVARFDRVLGSVHTIRGPDGDRAVDLVMAEGDPAATVEDYLAEVLRMAGSGAPFAVLAHIDYPVRSWPSGRAGPFDPFTVEDEFREALRATAASGRALEINTRIPLDATILRWWHEEGGDAVTFGSDAHEPALVAHGFREAADMAAACGFRPGKSRYALWARVD
jgi:histidinol-phosphatase (PHP family)